ncbi:MAG: (Fe-S)-binding protein [Pseudomonadota bacterium]
MKDILYQQAQVLHQECTRCQACVSQCAFLQENGTPGDIAASLLAGGSTVNAFECSLCNLCTAVCPAPITPGIFFLEMRRQIVARNKIPSKSYSTILTYERRGSSRLFSWYGLPSGCDTVFFPGCTLPGTRPETTWQLYQQLNEQIPHLGVVLDCCHKPSHDLGRQQYFLTWFEDMRDCLIRHGVRHIIVACPNCYKVFHAYGQSLTVRTVWEILAETQINPPHPAIIPDRRITVHDPCPLRDHEDVQQAVRTILPRLDLKIREMRHSGKRTICCGEGGSVGFVNRDMAAQWGEIRRMEAGDDLIITYCAGCAAFLARAGMRVVHLGDLLVNPAKALSGKASVARAPKTYLNRIRLKKRLQRTILNKPKDIPKRMSLL